MGCPELALCIKPEANRRPQKVKIRGLNKLVEGGGIPCDAMFAHVVSEAQRSGELRPSIGERVAACLVSSINQHPRVSAKAGASPETPRVITDFALTGLTVM